MNQTWIVALITTVLSGGLVYAFVAARKAGPERQSIIVDAAQGAVVVQSGVIDSLNDQLARLDERLQACERLKELVERELAALEAGKERDQLGREGRIERREQ